MAARTTGGAGRPCSRPWLPGPEQTAARSHTACAGGGAMWLGPSHSWECSGPGDAAKWARTWRSARGTSQGRARCRRCPAASEALLEPPHSLGMNWAGRSTGGPRGDALTHSLAHSLPCSLIHYSLAHSFTRSLARSHSFTLLLTHSLAHSLIYLLAHSLTFLRSSADGLHCTQSKAGRTSALPPAAITSQLCQ